MAPNKQKTDPVKERNEKTLNLIEELCNLDRRDDDYLEDLFEEAFKQTSKEYFKYHEDKMRTDSFPEWMMYTLQEAVVILRASIDAEEKKERQAEIEEKARKYDEMMAKKKKKT